MPRDSTRRRFIRIAGSIVTAGATAGLAGCSGNNSIVNGGDGGGSSSTEVLNVVPADATSVNYVDVAGMIEDGNVELLVDTVLGIAEDQQSGYDGPEDEKDVLDRIEDESGLDPRGMDEAVAFTKLPESSAMTGSEEFEPYTASWFTAEWDEDDVVDAIENGGTTLGEPDDDEAPKIYPPDEEEFSQAYLGVIAEGEYVFGTEDAVEDAADVSTGDEDSVGEEVTDLYAGVQSGLMKQASTVPADSVPSDRLDEEFNIDPPLLNDFNGTAQTIYSSGDQMGMEVSMSTETEDAAEDLRDVVAGMIAAMQQGIGDEELRTEVESLQDSIQQDGTSVSMSYENSAETLADLMEEASDELQQESDDGTAFAVNVPLS